jgi:hypothetical protein
MQHSAILCAVAYRDHIYTQYMQYTQCVTFVVAGVLLADELLLLDVVHLRVK